MTNRSLTGLKELEEGKASPETESIGGPTNTEGEMNDNDSQYDTEIRRQICRYRD